MAIPLFKDIGKNSNDLLKKGFPSVDGYKFRAEVDTTTENGVQFTPFIQDSNGNISGELKTKFGYKGFVFTASQNLKEDISIEATPEKATNGFKYTVNLATHASSFTDRLKAKLSAEYRNEKISSTASLEGPLKSGKASEAKLLFSTVAGDKARGVAAGVDLEVVPASQELKAVNGALVFSKRDYDFSIYSKTKLGAETATTVGTNFFQRLNVQGRDVVLAAELSYELNKKKTSLILGSQFKPDADTTVKVRADSKGLVGVAITEKWRGPLSVTLSSDLNLLGAAGEGYPPFQYGVKLAFK
eukprot:TRINITY_DN5081_c2_g1_i1.p1 TRINITY_DN5081_c2_g1~~TRINITY_DN5081_c2_g1_i1.p1  ORF type:complete len:301 (-),score=195.79 TRINITY_DN5081_c2_g1_i1:100-1002(-)